MTRARIPVVATLVVLVAVGIMVRLGFWQLDRLAQKEALLTRYELASRDSRLFQAGRGFRVDEPYRHVRLDCKIPRILPPIAGRNRAGRSGWAHRVRCDTSDFDILTSVDVVIGWSASNADVAWSGGSVTGVTSPGGKLVADPPLADLQPNAPPDPRDIPNNHLAYAVQWFLFAGVALVIYGLALRKRLRGK